MKNIKLIVKENLIKRFVIQESLNHIALEEDVDKKMNMAVEHLGKLIDEGYDNEGIEKHVDEQFDWLNKLMGRDTNNPADDKGMSSALNLGTTAAGNQIKIWAIKKFLDVVKIAPEDSPLSNGLAYALSEMSLRDIVSVMRSKQGCYAHSQDVARGVIDGLIAAIRADSGNKGTTVMGNFVQNIVSQALYNQGTFKKIGGAICNYFYDKKPNLTPPPSIAQKIATTTPQNVNVEKPDTQFKADTSRETSPL